MIHCPKSDENAVARPPLVVSVQWFAALSSRVVCGGQRAHFSAERFHIPVPTVPPPTGFSFFSTFLGRLIVRSAPKRISPRNKCPQVHPNDSRLAERREGDRNPMCDILTNPKYPLEPIWQMVETKSVVFKSELTISCFDPLFGCCKRRLAFRV